MNTQAKLKIISRNTEEILGEDQLIKLIEQKTVLKHYIGFEISGLVHLGTGLFLMGKVADLIKADIECNIFLADWHTYINEKLDGNWDHIIKAGEGYFKEAMIASLACWGIKKNQVNFVLASDLYKNSLHWKNLMEVSKHTTLSRVQRSTDIMGRSQGKSIDFARLIYPPLQVADIYTLGVNIAHSAIDQRKAHVIARQVASKMKISPLKDKKGRIISPIAIHQPLIMGLKKPPIWPIKTLTRETKIDMKMSKSDPGSCIFIHDTPDQIMQKINHAFCPPMETEFNPIINWTKHLIFWGEDKGELLIKRTKEHGGDKAYVSFSQVKADYISGKLHPQDLKQAVGEWLIKKLAPARKHFETAENSKKFDYMKELQNARK
jgi:tyrosyl-tRNA synthetase